MKPVLFEPIALGFMLAGLLLMFGELTLRAIAGAVLCLLFGLHLGRWCVRSRVEQLARQRNDRAKAEALVK